MPDCTPTQGALGPATPVMFDLMGTLTCGLSIPMLELTMWLGNALEYMLVSATDHIGAAMGKALGLQHIHLIIPVHPSSFHLHLPTSGAMLQRGRTDICVVIHMYVYMYSGQAGSAICTCIPAS
ncbi:hypothetical protein ID866_12780 [Astraeus odoratus]|nr:hypothetical protein ID866_12780 [Astraeus odoratus]